MNAENIINPDKILRADILLVHTNYSLISKIIRKFSKSYWNHCGLFVSKDDQWPKWIIESVKKQGVVGSPFELKYLKVIRDDDGRMLEIKPSRKYNIAIVRVKGLTYQQRRRVSARAYHWAIEERKYDYLLFILGMIIHLMTFRRFYPKWLRSATRFTCSELIASAFYKEADFKFSKYTECGYVTPADIAKTAKEKDNVEIVMTNSDIV